MIRFFRQHKPDRRSYAALSLFAAAWIAAMTLVVAPDLLVGSPMSGGPSTSAAP